jgi:hypothetical protein
MTLVSIERMEEPKAAPERAPPVEVLTVSMTDHREPGDQTAEGVGQPGGQPFLSSSASITMMPLGPRM